VFADGALIAGVLEADVFRNAHLAADRFRVHAALSPANAAMFQPGVIIDVQVALDGPPVSLVQGEVDTLTIDPIRRTVELDGRDLTARLLDARTQETFANQTASEIAETLAGRHGLTPAVTATTTLAGRYYGDEHDRIVLGQFSRALSEWDLLTFLATREGFEVFVQGSTLVFQPPAAASPVTTLDVADCLSLSLDRALTLARDIEVTVKSWNTRHQAAFVQTARSSARGGRRGGPPQRIVVVRPNLTAEEALQLAQRILADLSRHERVVHAELPGELALTPRSQVTLTGTGTDFDQAYFVADLDRQFSLDHGFTQRLRLKNTSPASGATPPADNPSP
jgi:phage protein D